MLDIKRNFVTEDFFVDWVKEKSGILHTRKLSNINNVDLSNCKPYTLVCLTGNKKIVAAFFKNTIQKFRNKIILITIETDGFDFLDTYVKNPIIHHWFTWNKPYDHHKLTCLPIGLNQDRHLNPMLTFLSKKLDMNAKKKLCALNESFSLHPERKQLLDLANTKWSNFCSMVGNVPYSKTFYSHSYTTHYPRIKIEVTDSKYYHLLSEYKFILSPPGGGMDCHRTWEALYMGTVPILLSSSIDELYNDLPVLIVDNWDILTKEFLESKYMEIQSKLKHNEYNMDKLYFDYWKNLIEKKIEPYEEKMVPK